jgi:hypothetical protein
MDGLEATHAISMSAPRPTFLWHTRNPDYALEAIRAGAGCVGNGRLNGTSYGILRCFRYTFAINTCFSSERTS